MGREELLAKGDMGKTSLATRGVIGKIGTRGIYGKLVIRDDIGKTCLHGVLQSNVQWTELIDKI